MAGKLPWKRFQLCAGKHGSFSRLNWHISDRKWIMENFIHGSEKQKTKQSVPFQIFQNWKLSVRKPFNVTTGKQQITSGILALKKKTVGNETKYFWRRELPSVYVRACAWARTSLSNQTQCQRKNLPGVVVRYNREIIVVNSLNCRFTYTPHLLPITVIAFIVPLARFLWCFPMENSTLTPNTRPGNDTG